MAIPAEYSNYNNIFSVENAIEFLKYTRINNYAIRLEKIKQLLFKHIYTLKLLELKTLKTSIETNLVNSFIWSFKSLTGVFFFSIKSQIIASAFLSIIKA